MNYDSMRSFETTNTAKNVTLAALMSSSAKHSAIVLMFLKAASRAPVHSSQIACQCRSGDEGLITLKGIHI